MLSAHSNSPFEAHDPSSVLGDGADLWNDAAVFQPSLQSSQTREGRAAASIRAFDGMQNGSASSSILGRAGLRSRKTSLHRRASSLASASHPLQAPSSPKGPTTSNVEGRRSTSRKRQASDSNLLDNSDAYLDDDFERETVREPEIMVIVHEVRLRKLLRELISLMFLY